jgi:hypothetical protein
MVTVTTSLSMPPGLLGRSHLRRVVEWIAQPTRFSEEFR